MIFEVEGSVSVAPDHVVKAGGHDDVLEAALDEELYHEGLVLNFGEFGFDLGFELASFCGGFDFGDAADVFAVG